MHREREEMVLRDLVFCNTIVEKMRRVAHQDQDQDQDQKRDEIQLISVNIL